MRYSNIDTKKRKCIREEIITSFSFNFKLKFTEKLSHALKFIAVFPKSPKHYTK